MFLNQWTWCKFTKQDPLLRHTTHHTAIIRWLVEPTLGVTEQMRADQRTALQTNEANVEVKPRHWKHTETGPKDKIVNFF